MNYKKIILATLVGISTLSFITFFNNDTHKENINLKFTDIYGDRKELDKEISATISTSYGKGRDINVTKNKVILTDDFDFDSELMQKKEDIIKNKKFYKNAKGYAISNMIENNEEKLYGKLIKDSGSINIYQLKNNDFKEFKIPLNKKDLQMIKTNEQSYLRLIGESGSKFYAALIIQNLYGNVLKRLLIEIDSEKYSYKSLELNVSDPALDTYYFMNNNKVYFCNTFSLYTVDFVNNKFNKLMSFESFLGDQDSLLFDKNYFYAFHQELPNKRTLSAFNLATGDIIDCGKIDDDQFFNISATLKGNKLYKIYAKPETGEEYDGDVEKTNMIIEISDIKEKKILYKGDLEINKNINVNLKVA